jgi:hypothetical protein
MWWVSATAYATTCDAAAIEELSDMLAHVSPERRLALAAASWPELCTDDVVLDRQLEQIAGAKPDSYWLVELQTGMLDAMRWNKACSGGSLALSMATKLGASQRRAHLWKSCDLGRWSVMEPAEWEESAGLLVLPVLAAWTLTDGGVLPDRARPIVRALAGL